jgi:hypothetical protein
MEGSSMTRKRAVEYSRIVLLSCLLLAGVYASTLGQRFAVTHGATVRVSRPDSAGQPVWSTGRVVYVTNDRLLLAETDGDPLVRLNEAVRLQISRSHSKSVFGGVLGFGIGALAGWQVGHSAGGETNATAGSIAGALVGGIAGVGIGALIGNRIRSTSWEDVALEGGHIASVTPDETHTRPDVPLIGTYRWTQFDPTVANFQAFFEEQAQTLAPIEGIWARNIGRTAVAIVRVGGPDEDKYAAFTVVLPEGRPAQRGDGIMLFALELDRDGGRWFVRFPGRTARRFRANVDDTVLALEYAGGWWDNWEKLFPD